MPRSPCLKKTMCMFPLPKLKWNPSFTGFRSWAEGSTLAVWCLFVSVSGAHPGGCHKKCHHPIDSTYRKAVASSQGTLDSQSPDLGGPLCSNVLPHLNSASALGTLTAPALNTDDPVPSYQQQPQRKPGVFNHVGRAPPPPQVPVICTSTFCQVRGG